MMVAVQSNSGESNGGIDSNKINSGAVFNQ